MRVRSGRFHRHTSLIAVLAAGCLLAACGDGGSGQGPGEQNAGEDASITFVGADPPEAFAPLIKAFEAENPNIDVTYNNIPFDQFNNVIQQRVGGGDPSIDVLYVDPPAIPSYVERGWLEDLSEYGDSAAQNSIEAAIESSTYEDKMYALPMWTSEQFMYYNKDLLAAAGVEPPSTDPAERWTWEQTLDAARKAQDAGVSWGLLFDQTDRYYQLQALPESAGGGSGATGEDLLVPDVTNEGWMRAMQWYSDLFAEGYAPRGVETAQMVELFGAGDAAFFVGGPWSLTPIMEAGVDYGIAPHPYFDGGEPATPTDSWSLGVSTASDDKDAAKQFVEFASQTREGNEAAIDVIFIPPTNNEAFEVYTEKLNALDPPATEGAGELMLHELDNSAVHRPPTVGYTQMEDVMGRAFADIRNGEDVAKTLENAERQLESAWSRL